MMTLQTSVVTITIDDGTPPLHIVIPIQDGDFVFKDAYVLTPVPAHTPQTYTNILVEAEHVLHAAVALIVEGIKPDTFMGLGDWIPKPTDE